jgi:hypothetical protein
VKHRSRSTTIGNFPDWSEFIGLLTQHKVKFLVIGAHALAVLGRPRYTGDLDVLIEPTEANAERLSNALREFGFDALADNAYAIATPGRMVRLGRKPVQIDITNSISGVSFGEAWAGRIRRRVGKHFINFIGRQEYIKNKTESAKKPHRQAKDLSDLALLEKQPRRRRRR